MSDNSNVDGPYIVWHYQEGEGWMPRSYAGMKEAVMADGLNEYPILTRKIPLDQIEVRESQPQKISETGRQYGVVMHPDAQKAADAFKTQLPGLPKTSK